jgi:hypothetical protein
LSFFAFLLVPFMAQPLVRFILLFDFNLVHGGADLPTIEQECERAVQMFEIFNGWLTSAKLY